MNERPFFCLSDSYPETWTNQKGNLLSSGRRLPVQYRYSFVVVKSHSCNGTTFVFLINL